VWWLFIARPHLYNHTTMLDVLVVESISLTSLPFCLVSVYFFYSFGFPLKKKRATLTNQLCVMCVCWPGARDCHSVGRRCVAQLAAPFLPSFLRDRNMCRNKIRTPRVVWNVSTISPKVVSIPKATCYPIIQLYIHFFVLVSMGFIFLSKIYNFNRR
jgi:hypothetical protein